MAQRGLRVYNISNWRCEAIRCLTHNMLIRRPTIIGGKMGSRGSSSRAKGAASLSLETVPALVPKEIIRLNDPIAFGAAYANKYKNAQDATSKMRVASAAVSTWIAKNGYNSSKETTSAENDVYRGALKAQGVKGTVSTKELYKKVK